MNKVATSMDTAVSAVVTLAAAAALAVTLGFPVIAADVSLPCVTIHGRLFVANGAPSFRIWKVGTRRILGVVAPDARDSEDVSILPANVRHLFEGPVIER